MTGAQARCVLSEGMLVVDMSSESDGTNLGIGT